MTTSQRFIQATYHPNVQVAEFIAEDGRHLLRSGGSLPWRLNNCGDLVSPVNGSGDPCPKHTRGYIGFAKPKDNDKHFFIFPDAETGRKELKASLSRKYTQCTIPELVKKFAPSKENNTDKYIKDLTKETGIGLHEKVSDLSDSQLDRLVQDIGKLEGFESHADSRREVWVPVSTIDATNGRHPLADEEIVLRQAGKETVLKSNQVGQFPPIPHGKDPIEVLHRTSDNQLKHVGHIAGDTGQRWSLIAQVERFVGISGPDEPPSNTSKRRQPFIYVVQPHDSLSKLAAKFEVSVAQVKSDNKIRTDIIHPGDRLGIYGPLSPSAGENKVKRSPPKAAPAKAKETPKPPPATHQAANVRSDKGQGKPLAVISTDQGRAPWMAYAIAEAKRHKGAKEAEIEKVINYATEVHTGQTTLVGNNKAWCAAFVNWCLMKAGYPIENPSFSDHVAAKGRAHGFYEVNGAKDTVTKKAQVVRNPLFVQVLEPVYGAIAMVTSVAGHGHHVGFVYSKRDDAHVVLLGGNQSDQINFIEASIKPEPAVYKEDSNGKKIKVKKANPDHLMFFVPVAYARQAREDAAKSMLPASGAEALNKEFGVKAQKKNGDDTR